MTIRAYFRRTAPLMLALAALLPAATPAQDPAGFQQPIVAQSYKDPRGRFGFSAPPGWFQVADKDPDEVTFQNKRGDNMRITISPLEVPQSDFLAAYVDTYLEVLALTFTDVKFHGQRETIVAGREAHDFTFSAVLGTSPVTCRQVLVFGGDSVLYATFAGFGASREASEQLFNLSVHTLWVAASFGGASAAVSPTSAGDWPFDFQLPGGWIEYRAPADGTHIFRPANARLMSPMITAFANTPSPGLPTQVDDAFVKIYADRVCEYYKPAFCQIRTSKATKLGGEPAVRFDYVFAADTNTRRVSLVLAMHNGHLVGIACEAADAAYPNFERAFEAALASFRFK